MTFPEICLEFVSKLKKPFSRHDLLPLCKKHKQSPNAAGRVLLVMESRGQIIRTGGEVANGNMTRASPIYRFVPGSKFTQSNHYVRVSEDEIRMNKRALRLQKVVDGWTRNGVGA
jgi:hypothetical protein